MCGKYAFGARGVALSIPSTPTHLAIVFQPTSQSSSLKPNHIGPRRNPVTVFMARKSSFRIPFRHKSSHSTTSSRTGRSRNTSASASSRRSASTRSAVPSRLQAPTQPSSRDESVSTRALSESVIGDVRVNDPGLDDTVNEIIMAVNMMPDGTVGCCYYVAAEEQLFFMEDIQFGDVDVVDALRLFVNPTVVVVSTRIDDSVIDRFDPEAKTGRSASVDNDQFRLPFLLEVRPPAEFLYDAAKSKLVNLHLGDENGTRVSFSVPGELGANNHCDDENGAGQQGQLLRLAGWINVESRVTVSVSFRHML